MTPKQILLKAAARIANNQSEGFCCVAIEDVNYAGGVNFYDGELARDHFEELFMPYSTASYNWGGARKHGAEFWSRDPTPKRQEQRVLALLFAAHSYKDKS